MTRADRKTQLMQSRQEMNDLRVFYRFTRDLLAHTNKHNKDKRGIVLTEVAHTRRLLLDAMMNVQTGLIALK